MRLDTPGHNTSAKGQFVTTQASSKRHSWTIPVLCVVLAVLGAGVIYGLTDVNNDLTPEDVQAINSLGVSGECHGLHDFPAELRCVRSVQLSIKTHVSDMRCADKSQIIEPDQFLARGYGCCFDRARFIEKTLQFYGFQTRHLALHHLTIPVLGYLLPVNSFDNPIS